MKKAPHPLFSKSNSSASEDDNKKSAIYLGLHNGLSISTTTNFKSSSSEDINNINTVFRSFNSLSTDSIPQDVKNNEIFPTNSYDNNNNNNNLSSLLISNDKITLKDIYDNYLTKSQGLGMESVKFLKFWLLYKY